MRTCNTCHETKPLNEFYQWSHDKTKRRPQCKTCVIAEQSRSRGRNPDYMRMWHIQRAYKIDEDTYRHMLSQGCEICGTLDASTYHVDHDHVCCPGVKTCGKCVRGLLCRSCNMMLGSSKDSIDTLERAIEYLRKWG